ncbi:hypothetical protein DFH28DRAFT_127512 [Melampsora americana]|nr:hypothetical protein DFH28DRAFT_127512 [Melampsora americana]
MNSAVYKQNAEMDGMFESLTPSRSHQSHNHSYIESFMARPHQDKSICDQFHCRNQKIDHDACFGKSTCLMAIASGALHSSSHIHQCSSSKSTKEGNTGAILFYGSVPTNLPPPLRNHRSSLFSDASQYSSKSVMSLSSTPLTSVQSLNQPSEYVELSHWDRAGCRTSAEAKVGSDGSLSSRKKAYFRLSKIKDRLTEKAKQGIANVQGSPASSSASTHSEQVCNRFQGWKAGAIKSPTESLRFTRSTQSTVEQKKLMAREATTNIKTMSSLCSQLVSLNTIPIPPMTPASSNGGTLSSNAPPTLYSLGRSTIPDRKEPENVIHCEYVTGNDHPAPQNKARSIFLQPPADEDTDASEEEMDSIISGLLRISALRKPSTVIVPEDSNTSICSSTGSSCIAERPCSSLIESEEPDVESVKMTSKNKMQLTDDVDFDERRASIESLVAIDEQEEVIDYQLPIWPAMSSTIKSPFNNTSFASETKTMPNRSLSKHSPIQEGKRITKAGNRPLRVV